MSDEKIAPRSRRLHWQSNSRCYRSQEPRLTCRIAAGLGWSCVPSKPETLNECWFNVGLIV